MNEDRLNDFSRAFARALFGRFPSWRGLSVAADEESLEIAVPRPAQSELQRPLLVSTANGEVTIEFNYCHQHFDWPPPVPGDERCDPIAFLERLVDDEITVISYWKGDEWLGSTTAMPGADTAPPRWLRDLPDRVRVRSWSGRRNRG